MLIRKDKIIGLKVYDKKGRYVGEVRDIGFVLGENLVGIVVVGRDNREMEFIWSEVEAVEDIVILNKEVSIPAVTPAPAKPVAETHEEQKPQVKDQVSMKPPPYVPKEPEVRVVTSSELASVPEAQVLKEPSGYEGESHSEAETTPGLTPEETTSSPTTKVCPKCGAINNARYKFCFRCGTRLST